jgi:hypothetical protein
VKAIFGKRTIQLRAVEFSISVRSTVCSDQARKETSMGDHSAFEQSSYLVGRAFEDLHAVLGDAVASLGAWGTTRFQAQDFSAATEAASRCQRLQAMRDHLRTAFA